MRKKSPLYYSRGQSIGEYTVLIAIILSAVVAMQVYVQRSLQARYHAASLNLIYHLRVTTGNTDIPNQYEPYYFQTDYATEFNSNTTTSQSGSGTERAFSEKSTKKGTQAVLPGCAAGEPGCPAAQ